MDLDDELAKVAAKDAAKKADELAQQRRAKVKIQRELASSLKLWANQHRKHISASHKSRDIKIAVDRLMFLIEHMF
jgi:hypothetical protein